ncbi:hypothetical protein [Comamonas testosteroni]|uniref:hypothetical protein n=1 Tax=Comamonas testosteroni TaxID=285 RepID=UPI00155DBA16|nr:hypothetical protein [Comamonas testosteroni]
MRLKIRLWQMGDEHRQAQRRLLTEVIGRSLVWPRLAPLGIEPVLFDNICGNGCELRSGVDGAAERQPAMRGGYKAEAQLPGLCLMPAIEKHGCISTQLLLSGCHDLPDEIGKGFSADAQRLLIVWRKAPWIGRCFVVDVGGIDDDFVIARHG